MKLSEAIRLGALLHPQCFGTLYQIDGPEEDAAIVASCALGAAEQAGYRWWAAYGDRRSQPCPDGCALHSAMAGMIQHLNDKHRWTRERIADWVELQEGLQRAPDGTTETAAAWSPGIESLTRS
jgi:hypothetical protein